MYIIYSIDIHIYASFISNIFAYYRFSIRINMLDPVILEYIYIYCTYTFSNSNNKYFDTFKVDLV